MKIIITRECCIAHDVGGGEHLQPQQVGRVVCQPYATLNLGHCITVLCHATAKNVMVQLQVQLISNNPSIYFKPQNLFKRIPSMLCSPLNHCRLFSFHLQTLLPFPQEEVLMLPVSVGFHWFILEHFEAENLAPTCSSGMVKQKVELIISPFLLKMQQLT